MILPTTEKHGTGVNLPKCCNCNLPKCRNRNIQMEISYTIFTPKKLFCHFIFLGLIIYKCKFQDLISGRQQVEDIINRPPINLDVKFLLYFFNKQWMCFSLIAYPWATKNLGSI